ncbi:MAG: hypothetical protein AAB393_15520 [Bacteroidota bacterium]
MQSPTLTIDVAHPPRRPDEVEEELLSAWSQVRNSSSLRVLKIIHGYGSTGKGGTTKEVVRNWVFANRTKFKMSIDGEEYTLYNAGTRELRKAIGDYPDADLGKTNPGITIVWIR